MPLLCDVAPANESPRAPYGLVAVFAGDHSLKRLMCPTFSLV